ncbi:MatE family protein [Tritrichomonas foetus]|uniref:MatE family protein n=1 Tax=Tritrichomonas foetus TaxID=1144522 RepID=A0A1J4J905_9EUKA|nr:MatE family protein [Tritrichomonas foetus]|eukprot:OHS94163.1 MatE family protein [Tritrichomonas foetus]
MAEEHLSLSSSSYEYEDHVQQAPISKNSQTDIRDIDNSIESIYESEPSQKEAILDSSESGGKRKLIHHHSNHRKISNSCHDIEKVANNDDDESLSETTESDSKNKKDQMSPEHYRLAGRPPLTTLFNLSAGPILAQFTGSLKGVIGSIWISKALGETALAAISTIGVYDGISRSFGFFLSSSGSSKISQLYGQHRENEAGQVVVDLIRVSLIFGILVPLILGLTTQPLCEWLGADEIVQKMCHEYMLPINIGTFTTILFITLGGCLQGEGRSLFFSILNVASLVVNMCVFDPILLLALGTGIWGASVAQSLAEAIPGIALFIMFFMGKFGVKPKFSMFFNKFSPHTFSSMKVGFSQLIGNLSQMIPSILVRKLIGLAVGENFNDAMAAFNTVVRFIILTGSIIIAVTLGYVPAASYAFAAKNYQRWLSLSIHMLWMTFAWGSFTAILTLTIPRQLSSMFANGKGYLDVCEPMLKYSNALGFFAMGRFCGVAFLQSMQKGWMSTVLSLTSNFASIIGFAFLLYYTDKTNGVRIVWCYSLAHAFGFVMAILFMIAPIRKIVAGYKQQKIEDEATIASNSDNTSSETVDNETDHIVEA